MAMNPRLLRPISSTLDADAAVYLNAVAQADGQQLEPAVRKAINDFVVGCKQDQIWDAIKASCILAGARTLAGALVPLVGTAPTNNGPFVSGDYTRGGATPGLVSNGTNKYLDTNRANNADPQDDCHMAIYASTAAITGAYGGALGGSPLSGSQIYNDTATSFYRANSSSSAAVAGVLPAGLSGVSRSSSATLEYLRSGTVSSVANTSTAPVALTTYILARNYSVSPQRSSARVAFYSIGESLDLAALNARVSALITAIGAAL